MASLFRYREQITSRGGLATARAARRIKLGVRNGSIATTNRTVKEGERLDTIAFQFYGDGRLWWAIAAASGIGWWMQVPVGTNIKIPLDLTQIDGATA